MELKSGYGIESIRTTLTFNRTAYGIEIAVNLSCLTRNKLLLIAPLMELK